MPWVHLLIPKMCVFVAMIFRGLPAHPRSHRWWQIKSQICVKFTTNVDDDRWQNKTENKIVCFEIESYNSCCCFIVMFFLFLLKANLWFVGTYNWQGFEIGEYSIVCTILLLHEWIEYLKDYKLEWLIPLISEFSFCGIFWVFDCSHCFSWSCTIAISCCEVRSFWSSTLFTSSSSSWRTCNA